MPRRSHGQRFAPATEAVAEARARGENPTAALREYRRSGASIRTQEWYRLWNRAGEIPERLRPPVGPPITNEREGRDARDWITHVRVVYYVPPQKGRPARITSWWYEQISGGPQRMSDLDAVSGAITEGNKYEKQYQWVPVDAYVVEYEAIY